ncbi:MAG: transporter ATP-binding protein [Thermoproteota archaeon]|nr:transporter ATP-binding protein [Thermoproteota archaeon]
MKYAVEAFNLTKAFKGEIDNGERGVVKAVDQVNLKVREGELFGLLGPNGAGKTTLIKILCTIILPSEGTAKVNGYDVLEESEKVRSSFGWFHGETGGRSLYWRLSAEDNLRFYAYLQNVPRDVAEKRIDAFLEFFDLMKDRRKLVKDYSTGMKVKVMLARALLHNPPILFMDEPTIGLDTLSSVETRRLLKTLNTELGKTIIFTSHNMFEVEQLCERVAIMRSGKIIIDSSITTLKDTLRDIRAIEVDIRDSKNPDEIIQRLSQMPMVIKILEIRNRADNLFVRLQVEDEYEAIPQITERLHSFGTKIQSIRQVEPTFEDIFVKLTGKE